MNANIEKTYQRIKVLEHRAEVLELSMKQYDTPSKAPQFIQDSTEYNTVVHELYELRAMTNQAHRRAEDIDNFISVLSKDYDKETIREMVDAAFLIKSSETELVDLLSAKL